MKQQITLSQYRGIDLTILCVLMVGAQILIHFAVSSWFPNELYIASPVAAVVALVMMRWNAYAAIPALAGGLLFVGLSGGTWQHFLIYGIGNLLSLLAMLMFKLFGKEKIRQRAHLAVIFALCVQLLMQLGRAAIAAALGFTAAESLGFITTDALSILLTAVIIWIVRRVEGLFEDQINYLLRMERERQVEGRDQF